MFKALRIGILLFVLLNVALGAWLTKKRSTSWQQPLRVVIYPINADTSAASTAYIATLNDEHWQSIENFLHNEAQRFGIDNSLPVQVRLGPQVNSLPPVPPQNGNPLQIGWWSLQLRYWSWRHDRYAGARPDVRLFALYHDPQLTPQVAHSLGLEQGLIGVANLYADKTFAGRNQVVLTHELLHTVGASDKYDPASGAPLYPDGYAEPLREPRLPQLQAEIMAGRIPLAGGKLQMPPSLNEAMVGAQTAREIRWLQH
jgi:hypothetical protein